MTPHSSPRVWLLPLAAALNAVLIGGVASLFTMGSGGVSPLITLSGLALVAGMVGRWPGLVGALVGSLIVLLGPVLFEPAQASPPGMGPSLAAVAALAVQAAWGAWLVRRRVGLPVTPGPAPHWLRCVAWGGLVASALGAAWLVLANVVLAATGLQQALVAGLYWWLGSTLAVAVGAPVALCFVGSPPAAWRPRRFTVALPLITLTLLVAGASHWQEQSRQQHFKQQADLAAQRFADSLRGPLMALQATAALHQADARVGRDAWQASAAWWLRQPYALQRIGFAPAAPAPEGKRADAAGAQPDDSLMVRHVLGALDEASLVGLDLLQNPAARQAIAASRRSGQVGASLDFAPAVAPATRQPVNLYQAIVDSDKRVLRGVVWVTTSPQMLLDAAMGAGGAGLLTCLIDITQADAPQGLAGPPGCETEARTPSQQARTLPLADQTWQLRWTATVPADAGAGLIWWLGMGLVAASGALLLARGAGSSPPPQASHPAPHAAIDAAPGGPQAPVTLPAARQPLQQPLVRASRPAPEPAHAASPAASARPATDPPCHCRMKHTFMSRMSHELRTPLNAILGFSQLLCMDGAQALPARQRAWAQQVQHAGWHLLRMINDTLDLSRIDLDGVGLHPQAVALAPLIESNLAMVRTEADARGIGLRSTVDAQTGDLLAEAPRVGQILHHLLSNAIRYNRDGGQVHIQTQPGAPGFIDIVVTDTGPGLSPDQLAQLFEPYNRLGREGGPVPGSGLGLTISHRLAERMGGTLHAHSTLGQGCSFTLRLPQATADHTAPPSHRRLQPVPGSPLGGVVHYIEDDETNVEVMRGILLQRPDIELLVSTTGRQGLTMLRQRRPDLILLDMHLPDMNGHEFIQRLQQDRWLHNVPVIMLSADATEASADLALMAGARQYLTKPINVPELMAALDEVLAAEQPM